MKEKKHLLSLLFDGGTFFINSKSNVLAIYTDFKKLHTNITEALLRLAWRIGFSVVMYPEEKITEYKDSALKKMIDGFLNLNAFPSFLFTIIVIPDPFITDDTIYLGKTHAIDSDGYIDKMMEKKCKWLYVKNDESTDDQMVKMINSNIFREKNFLSTTIVLGDLGLKNLADFMEMIKKARK